jgi:putative glutamine amidotransferase
VNSSHHQAVDRLAGAFRPSAFSSDGVLEAFEWADPRQSWMLAVQWHPERMGDPAAPLGEGLFRRLVTAAAERER